MGELTKKNTDTANKIKAENVEDIVALLDGFARTDVSRMKLNVAEGRGEVISRQYHHGRCDIGSPWACGTPFDVLE